METGLVRYDAMCRAIQAAAEVDEVKDIHDKAIAIAAYERQIGNTEAELQFERIIDRAEYRLGILLREREMAKGGQPYQGDPTPSRKEGVQTLADLGITHKQSMRWQKLAKLPIEQVEAAIEGAKSKYELRAAIRNLLADPVEDAPPLPPNVTELKPKFSKDDDALIDMWGGIGSVAEFEGWNMDVLAGLVHEKLLDDYLNESVKAVGVIREFILALDKRMKQWPAAAHG